MLLEVGSRGLRGISIYWVFKGNFRNVKNGAEKNI